MNSRQLRARSKRADLAVRSRSRSSDGDATTNRCPPSVRAQLSRAQLASLVRRYWKLAQLQGWVVIPSVLERLPDLDARVTFWEHAHVIYGRGRRKDTSLGQLASLARAVGVAEADCVPDFDPTDAETARRLEHLARLSLDDLLLEGIVIVEAICMRLMPTLHAVLERAPYAIPHNALRLLATRARASEKFFEASLALLARYTDGAQRKSLLPRLTAVLERPEIREHCGAVAYDRRQHPPRATFPYRTRACELLGCNLPIVCAGMAYVSRADLVAAVSETGGFGVLGAGSMTGSELAEEIHRTRALTERPFGVDLWDVDPPRAPGQLDAVLELRPRALMIYRPSGTPVAMIKGAVACGISTWCLVRTVAEATAAADAGASGVICHGFEGGGHTGSHPIGTFALVPQVVDAVSIPVLAGGGVYDGRGLKLVARACPGREWSVGRDAIHQRERCGRGARISSRDHRSDGRGDDDHQILLRAPVSRARELLHAGTVDWMQEHEILPFGEQHEVSGERMTSGFVRGDREGQMPAGQAVGAIKDVVTARQIIEEMIEGG